jgi:hypothetical protein
LAGSKLNAYGFAFADITIVDSDYQPERFGFDNRRVFLITSSIERSCGKAKVQLGRKPWKKHRFGIAHTRQPNLYKHQRLTELHPESHFSNRRIVMPHRLRQPNLYCHHHGPLPPLKSLTNFWLHIRRLSRPINTVLIEW